MNQELTLFNIEKRTKKVVTKPVENYSYTPSPYKVLENALNNIFPQRGEETKTIRTRRLLGEVATNLTDEQLEVLNTKFQYLVDCWLDSFEKQVFQGKTLREVLRGK